MAYGPAPTPKVTRLLGKTWPGPTLDLGFGLIGTPDLTPPPRFSCWHPAPLRGHTDSLGPLVPETGSSFLPV